jgi:hypothetical protein
MGRNVGRRTVAARRCVPSGTQHIITFRSIQDGATRCNADFLPTIKLQQKDVFLSRLCFLEIIRIFDGQ